MEISLPARTPFKFGVSTPNISKFWLPLTETVKIGHLIELLHHIHTEGGIFPIQIKESGIKNLAEICILPYRMSDSDFYSSILSTVARVLGLPFILAQTVDESLYIIHIEQNDGFNPGFVEKVEAGKENLKPLLEAIDAINSNSITPLATWKPFRAQSVYRGWAHDQVLKNLKSGPQGISKYLGAPVPEALEEIQFTTGNGEDFKEFVVSSKANVVELFKLLPNGFIINAFQAQEDFVVNVRQTSQILDLLTLAGFWILPVITVWSGETPIIYLIAVNLYFAQPVERFLEPVEKAYHPDVLAFSDFEKNILDHDFSVSDCSRSLKAISNSLRNNTDNKVYILEPERPKEGIKGASRRKRFYDLATMDIKDYSELYNHFFRLSNPDETTVMFSESFLNSYESFVFILTYHPETDSQSIKLLNKYLASLNCDIFTYSIPKDNIGTVCEIFTISSYLPITTEALDSLYSAASFFAENASLMYIEPYRYVYSLPSARITYGRFIPLEPIYSIKNLQDLIELETGFRLDAAEFTQFEHLENLKGLPKVNFSTSLLQALNKHGHNAFAEMLEKGEA